MFDSRLLRRTQRLLRNRPRTVTYEHIATETKLGVRWLQQFAGNKIEDPGVRKVETLYHFLAAKVEKPHV
jgi:hypothetical protein